VESIQKQQGEVVWRDFVYRTVKGRSIQFKERKYKLIFAISNEKEPLSVREIAELPKIVRAYPNKASRALKHDIDALVKEGLIVRDKGKIRARIEAISGFKNITAV
jgi:hypothetical protein